MLDLKIMAVRDILPIAAVDFARGISPLSLDITGQGYSAATSVVINEMPAPEFIVMSDTQIIAEIPSTQANSPIRRVAVYAEKPRPSISSVLLFEAGRSVRALHGIERMVQQFVKLLLQTPGSDKFAKDQGGGLLSMVGRNVDPRDKRGIQTVVVSAIDRTRDQMIALQSRVKSLPNDERLLTAEADGVGFNADTTTLLARINLAAASGKQAVANLTF